MYQIFLFKRKRQKYCYLLARTVMSIVKQRYLRYLIGNVGIIDVETKITCPFVQHQQNIYPVMLVYM